MLSGTARYLAALAMAIVVGPVAAECPPADPTAPRTLILALDGVPYRAVRTAREMGAFAGWGDVRPLVSTFPSMTNVGFTAILEPFGADKIPGYEVRHYDPQRNDVEGGGLNHLNFEWREHFRIQLSGFWEKAGLYMTPLTSARKEMKHVERWVLSSSDDLMLALVSSTDSLTHFKGDHAIVRLLLEFSGRIEAMRSAYEAAHGRPLRLVMLSDHGNAGPKIRRPDGMKRELRRAGLHTVDSLERPTDVVATTYGVVGYGALYLDPANAEVAMRAVLRHKGVNLAAKRCGDHELQVLTRDGEAHVEWRDGPGGRTLSYRPDRGDPLGLSPSVELMRLAGQIDGDGFASRETWFEWTALARYPDGLARLVESLDGTWVDNAATVIFSFEQGYAWGVKPAEVAAWIRAGRLEATHGGLDRESTWGFFMTSDPDQQPLAVRADRALDRWAPTDACATASLMEFVTDDPHAPRFWRP